jgi:LuxR family maltose regulon positive regulatory protein
VRNGALARSRLCLARGDAVGARAAVEEAEEALGDPPSPLARAELLALKARVLLWLGANGEAARCADEAVDLAGWDRGQTGESAALAAAHVALALRAPAQAAAVLTRALEVATERGRLGAAIELHLLRGLAYHRQGERRAARADLGRALAIGEPEGYARVFLDQGAPMQAQLAQWLAHAGPGPLRDYAARLLAQFDAESRPTARTQEPASAPQDVGEALVEPLSAREREVLHLIALGKTNPEIAEQLVVSPGTVKAHASHIYHKLDVSNRTEAVARARALGLLP